MHGPHHSPCEFFMDELFAAFSVGFEQLTRVDFSFPFAVWSNFK